eukprot:m.238840 g.238840  ORF g.238840 m.238840 type:complete len:609 (-) comp33730_c0_seq12:94-1920(-)
MSSKLNQIRALFRSNKIQINDKLLAICGYVVPSEDAHASEYIAACDCRREFISGFSGSRGCAYITETRAAVFTDGRYFLQAENELLDGWELQKLGVQGAPSEEKWLASVVPPNSLVGVDPSLISAPQFRKFNKELAATNSKLVAVKNNLVDMVWGNEKPLRPTDAVHSLALKYCGDSVENKILKVREEMVTQGCSALVVTALDEVAWLFNLRGTDIPFNPVFFANALVTVDEIVLYIDQTKLPQNDSWNETKTKNNVTVKWYADFIADLERRKFTETVWVGPSYSQAVADALTSCKLCEDVSPICHAKSIKNDIELQGMKACHIRDSVALAEYFLWLETEIASGSIISEAAAADKLESLRAEQTDFVSLSFPTISSTGANGAVIHYNPKHGSCRNISASEVYLCDSGGQYKDGTTDVTRTVHFGTPTDHERDMFTRVLKGHISLATAKFPKRTTGLHLDSFARRALWDVQLDYAHGTGHGVGSFLNVHEGPHGIGMRLSHGEHALKPGMTVTIEPGYYENNNFGVRIENVVEVKATAAGEGWMQFEPFTLFPIQAKMINIDLLSPSEISWIDEYHTKTQAAIAPLLQQQGRTEALAWMEKHTRALVQK